MRSSGSSASACWAWGSKADGGGCKWYACARMLYVAGSFATQACVAERALHEARTALLRLAGADERRVVACMRSVGATRRARGCIMLSSQFHCHTRNSYTLLTLTPDASTVAVVAVLSTLMNRILFQDQ